VQHCFLQSPLVCLPPFLEGSWALEWGYAFQAVEESPMADLIDVVEAVSKGATRGDITTSKTLAAYVVRTVST
jgi:hypothetical protein